MVMKKSAKMKFQISEAQEQLESNCHCVPLVNRCRGIFAPLYNTLEEPTSLHNNRKYLLEVSPIQVT
jgi:hypothetical protein